MLVAVGANERAGTVELWKIQWILGRLSSLTDAWNRSLNCIIYERLLKKSNVGLVYKLPGFAFWKYLECSWQKIHFPLWFDHGSFCRWIYICKLLYWPMHLIITYCSHNYVISIFPLHIFKNKFCGNSLGIDLNERV